MKIETKFAIGEQVYYVIEARDCIQVYLDTITDICISESKTYYFTINCPDEIHENQIYKLEEFEDIRYLLIKKTLKEGLEDVEN